MAQDFYRRAQVLHEEFQQRELEYLNAEKKWNNMIWKKDLSIPHQEYIQKIDKRRRETEENYKNLMKQMGELDKQTDSMLLKLEKLGTLGGNMATFEVSNWQNSGLRSNPLIFPINSMESDVNFNFPSQKQNWKSVSTQTENKIYCDKCKSQVLACETSQFSVNDFQSTSIELQELADPRKLQHFSDTQNIIYESKEPFELSTLLNKNSSESMPYALKNQFHMISDVDKNLIIESKANEQAKPEDLECDRVLLQQQSTSIDNNLVSNRRSSDSFAMNEPNSTLLTTTKVSTQNDSGEQDIALQSKIPSTMAKVSDGIHQINAQFSSLTAGSSIDSMPLETKKNLKNTKSISHDIDQYTETVEVEDNIDISVSKSDEESMNHEFDFLETDTANASKSTKSHIKDKTPKSLKNSDVSVEKKIASAGMKSKEHLTIVSENHQLNSLGDRSDLSESITGPATSSIHSKNISIASDSDSIEDKEISLKASAAYQALLGNTAVLQNTKKKYLDSESEDEVENVLASAVRKNSQVLSNQKKEGEKSLEKNNVSAQQVDSKSNKKLSITSLASKPQSKLSKSTRKVLGLDSSSASEGEIVTKPSRKEIDEDSDEFDFFD